MEKSSSKIEEQIVESPFDCRVSLLCIGNWNFETCFGYALLELLIRLKRFADNLGEIWDFFNSDMNIREIAKTMNKSELFTCFHRLIRMIYYENIIRTVEEFREFVLEKPYWIKSIEFYFSIANPLQKIAVHVIKFNGHKVETLSEIKYRAPLIIIHENNGFFNAVNIEKMGVREPLSFPNFYL